MPTETHQTTDHAAIVEAVRQAEEQQNAKIRQRRERDCVSELRIWLMTYSGMDVSTRDAENLAEFLAKSGWTQP